MIDENQKSSEPIGPESTRPAPLDYYRPIRDPVEPEPPSIPPTGPAPQRANGCALSFLVAAIFLIGLSIPPGDRLNRLWISGGVIGLCLMAGSFIPNRRINFCTGLTACVALAILWFWAGAKFGNDLQALPLGCLMVPFLILLTVKLGHLYVVVLKGRNEKQ